MENFRLTLSFTRAGDTALEDFGQGVLVAMTDNPNYPSPTPTMAIYGAALLEYTTALAEASTRDKMKVAVKNTKRTALIALLKTLAAYVTMTAGDDPDKLVTSGFKLAKEPQPSLPLAPPQNFTISNGMNVGEIITSVTRVAGARSYIHQYTPDPLTEASDWEGQTTTTRKYQFANMESGKRYWFRIAAVGINNQVIYTSPQSRIAL